MRKQETNTHETSIQTVRDKTYPEYVQTQDDIEKYDKYINDKRYRVLRNGAVLRVDTGKICAKIGALINKDNAAEYHAMYRRKRTRDKVAAAAKVLKLGKLREDADDIELYKAASNVRQALYAKLIQVYMDSNDLRGMTAVLKDIVGDDESTAEKETGQYNNIAVLLMQYVEQQKAQSDSTVVLEADVVE